MTDIKIRRRSFIAIAACCVFDQSVAAEKTSTGMKLENNGNALSVDNPRSFGSMIDLDWFCQAFGYKNVSRDVLNHAIKYARGNILYIPAGIYDIEGDDILFLIDSPIALVGVGAGNTVFNILSRSRSQGVVFEIRSSGFSMSGITLNISNAANNTIVVKFSGSTQQHLFHDVRIHGVGYSGRDTELHKRAHGIYLDPLAQVFDLSIENCRFENLAYGIFTANEFKGRALRWSIRTSSFINNMADDIEFNSSDNGSATWDGILVDGCYFDGSGRIDLQNSGFAIGTDSGVNVIIVNNKFVNYMREAIHIEDYTRNIEISNNLISNCKTGIMVYQNNSSGILISSNIIEGLFPSKKSDFVKIPNAAGIGIYIANPGVETSSTMVNIFGNTITGFDFGIYAPVDRGGKVNNNVVGECIVGLYFPDKSQNRANGNSLFNCKNAFYSRRASIARNTVENCNSLLTAYKKEVYFSDGMSFVSNRIKSTRTSDGYFSIILACGPLIGAMFSLEIRYTGKYSPVVYRCRHDVQSNTYSVAHFGGQEEWSGVHISYRGEGMLDIKLKDTGKIVERDDLVLSLVVHSDFYC